MKVWYCKIGFEEDIESDHPHADTPMRKVVQQKVYDLFGKEADFCFSGWGGELDSSELAALKPIENS